MNYVSAVKLMLAKKIDVDNELLNLYTLIVFIKGSSATLEDIHDAWAIWVDSYNPHHKSLIPFNDLSKEVQELDRVYAEAIRSVAMEIKQ